MSAEMQTQLWIPSRNMLEEAKAHAARANQPLMEALADIAGQDPATVVAGLGAMFGFPVLEMTGLNQLQPRFDLLDYAASSKLKVFLSNLTDGGLIAVFSDPFDARAVAYVEEHVAQSLSWQLAHPADIAAYLGQHEEGMRALDTLVSAEDSAGIAKAEVHDLSIQSISDDTSPIVRLVHSTLYDALKLETSDIHLEATGKGLTIKYRMDGVLKPMGSMDGVTVAEQVISRIKVISELDISETRIPQDGRFKISMRGREIDIRVSIMPSIHGEDAVLRILDKKALTDQAKGLTLDSLGFDERAITTIRKMATEPYGMVLVTGPTGSGKTTTLYAAVSEIHTGEEKIITIEDPVEYQLSGILQIPVNEKKGLTFARGLRSILRHDPDKIMVGEIRDPETAQIAIQSALTGHLVFTTVHANNVLDVIGRFTHMGVDLYNFVSAINGILAQRLVRVLCPKCKVEEWPDEELIKASNLQGVDLGSYRFTAARGCGHCRGTGYRGRKAIAEIVILNDEIREMIVDRAPSRVIREAAHKSGTRFLRESALDLVRSGDTSLKEINRVTFVS